MNSVIKRIYQTKMGKEGGIGAPVLMWFFGVPTGICVLLWFLFFRG